MKKKVAVGVLQGGVRSFKARREVESLSSIQMADAQVKADGVISFLRMMFSGADVDGSGSLSAGELSSLVRNYYKEERVARSLVKVEGEVARAMEVFDTDNSGDLSFDEFIMMVAKSEEFKFKLNDAEKTAIIDSCCGFIGLWDGTQAASTMDSTS